MADKYIRKLAAYIGFDIDNTPLEKLDRLMDAIREHMESGSFNRFERNMDEAGRSAKKAGDALQKADRETKQLGNDAANAERKFRSAGSAADHVNRRTEAASSSARSLKKEVDAASKAHEGLARKAGSAIASANSMSLNLIGTTAKLGVGATVGVGAASVAGSLGALKLAGEKENSLLAMSFFTGSDQKGQDTYDKLLNFAATTPYEMPFVREQATGLMGMYKGMAGDNFDADKMVKDSMRALTAFGNAAGLTGAGEAGADRALLGFRQIGTIGKLQLEELRQVTENLLIPMELIRKELGLTQEEMASVGDKNIPAAKAMEAIMRALEKNFGGGMEKLSKTLLGMTSTIRDTSRIAVTSLGEGMAEPVKDILEDIIGTTDYTSDRFKAFQRNVERVGRGAGNAIKYLYTETKRYAGQAVDYLNRNFINNQEFRNLPTLERKAEFVLKSFKSTFDAWYEGGGNQEIKDATSSLIGYLGDALSGSKDQLSSIGVDLGKSVGSGMLAGLKEFAKSNPEIAAILTFIVTPGPIPVKAAAAAGVGAGSAISNTVEAQDRNLKNLQSGSSAAQTKMYNSTPENLFMKDTVLTAPKDRSFIADWRDRLRNFGIEKGWVSPPEVKVDGSNRDGHPYIPFDGYISELHEGERVLTAQENREYSSDMYDRESSMTLSPIINITIQGNGSRQDAYNGTMAALDEWARSYMRRKPRTVIG